MEAPAFSIFSAISELLVTAVVLYAVIRSLRGQPLAWRLLGAVLLFEICVNVVYMAQRAAHAEQSTDLSAGLRGLYAAHGILSLLMLIGLIAVYLLAVADHKQQRPTWFRRHPGLTWAFLALWLISVASGELIFVLRYGEGMLA